MKQMKNVKAEIVPLIRDVCMKLTGHAHDNEVRLLLGTAAAESGLIFRKQLEGGPARGLWQMEAGMTGAMDGFVHYLAYQEIEKRQRLWQRLVWIWLELEQVPYFAPTFADMERHLERYDDFACAMARLKYLRDPDPIPDSQTGRAEYWLRVYNGGGKGTVDHYLEMWESCECEKLMNGEVI